MQNKDELISVNIYCPLTVTLEDRDEYGNWQDPVEVSTAYAEMYEFEVREAISNAQLAGEANVGLMAYFRGSEAVKNKVVSLEPDAGYFNGKFYGMAKLKCTEPLLPDELQEIKEYISGQFSDGWGEGFEQRAIRTPDGDLYINFWNPSKEYFFKTEQEMQQNRGMKPPVTGKER